jgi:hypothetical protein
MFAAITWQFDGFNNRFSAAIIAPKRVFTQGGYSDIYGWLHFISQNRPPAGFPAKIESLLGAYRSAGLLK